MNKNFKFEMTVDQANIVFTALSRMPYESVAVLIAELQKQAQAQVEADQPKNSLT